MEDRTSDWYNICKNDCSRIKLRSKCVVKMFWLLTICMLVSLWSSCKQMQCKQRCWLKQIMSNLELQQVIIITTVIIIMFSAVLTLNGNSWEVGALFTTVSTLCSKKSDAKIQINITMAHLIRINYPLSNFNYCLSGTNVANFNRIRHTVSEQQPFKKWNSKTEFSNIENTD